MILALLALAHTYVHIPVDALSGNIVSVSKDGGMCTAIFAASRDQQGNMTTASIGRDGDLGGLSVAFLKGGVSAGHEGVAFVNTKRGRIPVNTSTHSQGMSFFNEVNGAWIEELAGNGSVKIDFQALGGRDSGGVDIPLPNIDKALEGIRRCRESGFTGKF